ncbi:phytanoyl-CoA dioxygenase family protein [Chamaesiphon sp. VAR_69_metabat_338]|uniref:phytanoyl-CoA dioxygenase family protein n=1 Tax=Chamaesiphon sp. VAR_69_metabat_338 TaxID=2964704 RepID=UPI00286DADAB|nr:phytanoyl-CoA dioxygenase family protein [Chamaesiphon sp. VAR_69_metabat_338]
MITRLVREIETNGFTIVDRYLDAGSISGLIRDLSVLDDTCDRAGVRNLLELAPNVRNLARSKQILALVAPILGDRARLVRGIFFDKQPGVNWKVPWHQDLTIAVKQRLDIPDYHPWSVKAAIPHVRPPVAILEQMLTVRIHLDRTDESNGALKVIPGSHCHGKLTDVEIDRQKRTTEPIFTNCEAGGILLMRPLLLHASSMGTWQSQHDVNIPSHRRVIHLEYTNARLADGLEWFYE